MNEAQQHQPESARPASEADDAPITITIHRGLHAAALHLANHQISAYDAYISAPQLDHGELHDSLGDVTASGIELDLALKVAHELANHLMPAIIGGRPTAFVIIVTECEKSLGDLPAVLSFLKHGHKAPSSSDDAEQQQS